MTSDTESAGPDATPLRRALCCPTSYSVVVSVTLAAEKATLPWTKYLVPSRCAMASAPPFDGGSVPLCAPTIPRDTTSAYLGPGLQREAEYAGCWFAGYGGVPKIGKVIT